MPRTLLDLVEVVRLAAGGAIDPRYDAKAIVNDAGQHIVAMHEWNFLKRPAIALDLVANQPFITLPAGVARIDGVKATSALIDCVEHTSLDHLNELRGQIEGGLLNYHVALEWPEQTDANSPAPGVRLAVYPTPTSDVSGAFRLAYTAGWRVLTANNQVHCLPADMETLLIQVIREMTIGLVKQNDSAASGGGRSAVDRLEALSRSFMVEHLKVRYGQMTGNLGQARGGVIESTRGRRGPLRHHSSVGMPDGSD